MSEDFFSNPVLNSPYEYPARHWELDEKGQPTQRLISERRKVDFETPIPKAKKTKGAPQQEELILDEGKGLSSQQQQYQIADTINRIRHHVDQWRLIPNSNDWRVTSETARFRCEIKGYRREDAKAKKLTMDSYWIPGVNRLGTYGRWAFAEFSDVWEMQADFAAKVEEQFEKMLQNTLQAEEGFQG